MFPRILVASEVWTVFMLGISPWISFQQHSLLLDPKEKVVITFFNSYIHNGMVVPQCVCNTALDPHVTSDNDNRGTQQHLQQPVPRAGLHKRILLYTGFGLGSRKFVYVPDLAWHVIPIWKTGRRVLHTFLSLWWQHIFQIPLRYKITQVKP